MGRFDYYKSGDWNAECDVCGQKYKASKLKLRWDGLRVCPKDFEFRHPQDFVRGVRDSQSTPFSRPEPPDIFAAFNWTQFPNEVEFISSFDYKDIVKNINNHFFAGGINSSYINQFALNSVEPFSPSVDDIITSDSISLSSTKGLSETVSELETISFSLYTNTALNGSAINFSAIG